MLKVFSSYSKGHRRIINVKTLKFGNEHVLPLRYVGVCEIPPATSAFPSLATSFAMRHAASFIL